MGKLNNQQRKNLCSLVDVRADAEVKAVDMSDENLLVLTSIKLQEHKDYKTLQKKYDDLDKKWEKRSAQVKELQRKQREELDAIDLEKDEVRKKINLIGIKPSSGEICHDKRYIGRNYKDDKYKVVCPGETQDVWDSIKDGLVKEIVTIQAKSAKLKEKIWLCETTETAEAIIKKG